MTWHECLHLADLFLLASNTRNGARATVSKNFNIFRSALKAHNISWNDHRSAVKMFVGSQLCLLLYEVNNTLQPQDMGAPRVIPNWKPCGKWKLNISIQCFISLKPTGLPSDTSIWPHFAHCQCRPTGDGPTW